MTRARTRTPEEPPATRAERSKANREAWRARHEQAKAPLTVTWPDECDDPERYLSERWRACREALSLSSEPEKWMPIERAAARELRIFRDNAASAGETEIQRARRLHRYAIEDGSWSAAAAQERRIAALEAAQRQEEERQRRAAGDDRIAALAESIQRLPAAAQEKLRAKLGWTVA